MQWINSYLLAIKSIWNIPSFFLLSLRKLCVYHALAAYDFVSLYVMDIHIFMLFFFHAYIHKVSQEIKKKGQNNLKLFLKLSELPQTQTETKMYHSFLNDEIWNRPQVLALSCTMSWPELKNTMVWLDLTLLSFCSYFQKFNTFWIFSKFHECCDILKM